MDDVNQNRVGWQCVMDDVKRSLGLAGVEGVVVQTSKNTAFCFFSGKQSIGHGEVEMGKQLAGKRVGWKLSAELLRKLLVEEANIVVVAVVLEGLR